MVSSDIKVSARKCLPGCFTDEDVKGLRSSASVHSEAACPEQSERTWLGWSSLHCTYRLMLFHYSFSAGIFQEMILNGVLVALYMVDTQWWVTSLMSFKHPTGDNSDYVSNSSMPSLSCCWRMTSWLCKIWTQGNVSPHSSFQYISFLQISLIDLALSFLRCWQGWLATWILSSEWDSNHALAMYLCGMCVFLILWVHILYFVNREYGARFNGKIWLQGLKFLLYRTDY